MKIEVWGRGGEIVLGGITREQYIYWALRNSEDDEEFSNMIQGDPLEEDHPPELLLGAWYDIDNIAHEAGPGFEDSGITVTDSKGNVIFDHSFTAIQKMDGCENIAQETNEYYFIETEYEYGFLAVDTQKGVFEQYEVPGDEFDPTLFKVSTTDVEGLSLITSISYNGKELEGLGMLDTESKNFDWNFISSVED